MSSLRQPPENASAIFVYGKSPANLVRIVALSRSTSCGTATGRPLARAKAPRARTAIASLRTIRAPRVSRDSEGAQNLGNGAAQGHRQDRSPAEPNDEIRPCRRGAEPAGELGADGRNLDGLVEMRGANPEKGRLQGEALKAAADPRPMLRIGAVSDKDRDSGR